MAEYTEDEKPARHGGRADNVVQLNPAKPRKGAEFVSFDRRELDQILRLYGYKVAAGEWRDYAIDMLRDRAVFSVFKRTAEVPLFAIEKNPKLARRQGAYCVVNATGQVLKRGHELANVLRVFEKKTRLATL
ncbi:MAG: DUF2794 domain-containing protein [Nitratireductor sp.]|nr:DUF2794 domain-containing protein [Nitratireductor sp.]